MNKIPISLIVLALLIFGAIILQIFLSKKESKWLGLILPSITFLYSLIIVLGQLMYVDTISFIFTALVVFIMANIPTIVLICIYFGCREKLKKKSELDKMKIEDLG